MTKIKLFAVAMLFAQVVHLTACTNNPTSDSGDAPAITTPSTESGIEETSSYDEMRNLIDSIGIDFDAEEIIGEEIKTDSHLFDYYINVYNSNQYTYEAICQLDPDSIIVAYQTTKGKDFFLLDKKFIKNSPEFASCEIYIDNIRYKDYSGKLFKGEFIADYSNDNGIGTLQHLKNLEFIKSYNVIFDQKNYICEEWGYIAYDGFEIKHKLYFEDKKLLAFVPSPNDNKIVSYLTYFSDRADESKIVVPENVDGDSA